MEISVCMIVKNEQQTVGRILECVKKFADEIIVVDTGSTDKTKEIAKKYTSKIFDFVWCDDFSKARNYSFSKASKDFVMWLDADDFITDENIEKICNLKNCDDVDCFLFKYATAFDAQGNPTFEYFRERLLRRSFDFKWSGFIHEAIAPQGRIKYVDIQIQHKKEKTNNQKRNLLIYQKHKRGGAVFNAREQYYYSKELFYNSYYKKCVKELKKFLKMPNLYLPNVYDAVLTISRCLNFLKDYSGAISNLLNFLKQNTLNGEMCCELGKSFLFKNQYKNAIFFYQAALNCKIPTSGGAFIEKDCYYLIPLLQLTFLNYKIGNFNEAKAYHLKAKTSHPTHPAVSYNDKFFSENKL